MNARWEQLEHYVRARFGPSAVVERVQRIGGGDTAGKGFGYGDVLRVTLRGAPWSDVVVHTARRGGFGHDTLADCAASALEPWESFNAIPAHVQALDVGTIDPQGGLRSLGEVRDFFLVTAWGEGEPYFEDLDRIARTGEATDEDEARCERLAEHLVEIHRQKKDAPELYLRRLRALVGSHECIAGLLDSYDGHHEPGVPKPEALRALEHWAVDWRHRLKASVGRLARIHGDFHPWNILFDGSGFTRRLTLLDASRGLWGEPADDLAALAVNYVFFSQRAGHAEDGALARLFRRFFETYVRQSGDPDVLRVIPPYLAWRLLVVGSPVWYPTLEGPVRARLFEILEHLRRRDTLDLHELDAYFAPPRRSARSPSAAMHP